MENLSDWITPRVAAEKYLSPLSVDHVTRMCRQGIFPSACKPGSGKNAHWRILRAEVIQHRLQGRTQILQNT